MKRLSVAWSVLAFLLLPIASRAQAPVQGGTALPADPVPAADQFKGFAAPPYALDQVRGELVNLETELIKPIITVLDGSVIAVVNEPDDRVVFLDTNLAFLGETVLGQGIIALAERPAPVGQTPREIWASVTHQSAVMVITTDGFRVTHLLRPDINATAIGAGHAALPGGIAFNASGTKAYVAATVTDSVVVYDAATKQVATTILLEQDYNGKPAQLNDPYYVLEYQGSIYVASHVSGNDTIAQSSEGDPGDPNENPNILGPDDVTVVDLGNVAGFSLPDYDVARISTSSDSVLEMARGLGSMIFGIAAHPPLNRIAVSSFDSRNGELIGERSFVEGRVVRNQVGHFLATTPLGPSHRIILEDLGPATQHVAMPTDMVADAAGRFYIAGYGSANIAVYDASANFLGTIPTHSGPRGLAVSSSAQRLYCLNRGAGTVTAFDISGASVPTAPVAVFGLSDPTYDRVKEGRQIFLQPNSGVGSAGCFSCHPDARKDGLGWQLSKFLDDDESFSETSPPSEWKDLKGVMVTQDLRSLPDNPPYHWRGEQKDLDDFNGAFKNLLKGDELDPEPFAKFKDYVFSTVYPANPRQQMNRVYSESGLRGFAGFNNQVTTGDGLSCNTCHSMPTGTNCESTDPFIGISPSPRATKTAQLRAMFTKASALANIDEGNANAPFLWPMTGFGFAHEGLIDSVAEFNEFFFGGSALAGELPFVTQFIDELDTGLAPATAYSILLNSSTIASGVQGRLRNYLMLQSVSGNCDIAVRGRLFVNGVWKSVGLFHNKAVSGTLFTTDDNTNYAWTTLQQMAAAGTAELLFLGVPVGSGKRIGVDRDRDGVFDAKELTDGTDPRDPDTDNDYLWDGYDPQPLNGGLHVLPVGAPTVSNIVEVFQNTNAIKIQYETSTFSPSRIEFGESIAYGFFAGDPLLPTGLPDPPSNHWKKHHTVILRPHPEQSLQGLKDGITYHYRIWTQGQNGQVAQTDDMTADTISDLQQNNRRVGSIVLNGVDNFDGTFTYTSTVTIVTNTGAPSDALVPGRFAFYDTSDPFQTPGVSPFQSVHLAVRTVNGTAVFQATTPASFQTTDDFTSFDVPMRLEDVILEGSPITTPATSVPTGFGSSGTPGPVLDVSLLQNRTLQLTAAGTWCRNATRCSGPEGDAGAFTSTGPLPGDLYNLLGGEWQGGTEDGIRFAIGASLSVVVPSGASGLLLFFNDDLNAHGNNTGSVTVDATVDVISFAGHWPEGVLAKETNAP